MAEFNWMTARTYWSSQGELQNAYEFLNGLIPTMGECPPDRPALERLRLAANAYCDLYTNGGGNRAALIAEFTGYAPDGYDEEDDEGFADEYQYTITGKRYPVASFNTIAEKMEAVVTDAIRAASDEAIAHAEYIKA